MRILAVILLAVLLAAFGMMQWFKVNAPKQFKIERIHLTLSKEKIFLRLSTAVLASGLIYALLDSMRYRVSFDTIQFSSGIKYFNKTDKDSVIVLPLHIDRKKFLNASEKLRVKDSAQLNITIVPFLKFPIIRRFPFTITKKMRVPIPPAISLHDMDMEKFRLHEMTLNAVLQGVNYNPVEFILLDADIYLDFPRMFDGVVSMTDSVHLKKLDTTFIPAIVQLQNVKIARTAWNYAFKKDQMEFDLLGKLYIAPKDEPNDTIEVILEK